MKAHHSADETIRLPVERCAALLHEPSKVLLHHVPLRYAQIPGAYGLCLSVDDSL